VIARRGKDRSSTADAAANSVLACLQVKCAALKLAKVDAERAVISRGRPFIGIERPKGYRHQRAIKQCFWNAADAAMRGRGTYVEGFVVTPDDWWPFHHAWLTLDGQHAIDQTLPDAPKCHYFGSLSQPNLFATL
jgi:hypothetical protein